MLNKPLIRSLKFILVFLLLALSTGMLLAAEPAWVDVGEINVEHGLSMLNGSDGQNESATVGGSECRRNLLTDAPSSYYYTYFDYDNNIGRVSRPVYVTVEYFDEGFGTFRIQYDSADLTAPSNGAYKNGSIEVLLDSRKWRKITFELPDARFDGRQNMGADFRLFSSSGLAIRRVKVEMGHSADFDKQPQVLRERIKACAGKLDTRKGVQVVFSGIDAAFSGDAAQVCADMRILAPMLKALGATSVESYVRWDLVETSQGKWDWSLYDSIVKILRENGLKWNPYIVIGPAYATPQWFRDSKESVFATCIEHNTPSKIQSIWNHNLPERVDRFLAQFALHYGSMSCVESVVLGISGDYGEAVYPVTSGGWTTVVPGEYHTHSGFWCGDTYAREDFQKAVKGKYGSVSSLNDAWKTNYESFDKVQPFLPENSPSARAQLDFFKWYRDSMTNWAEFWLESARKYMPHAEIYLRTGGDGQPAHGADFVAQCKVAADAHAGVRISNESSDYALDFACTRLIATAGKFYRAGYEFEASGAVTNEGIKSRVFNAVTSGSKGLHIPFPSVLIQSGGIDAWSKAHEWLDVDGLRNTSVAVLYPETTLSLKWGGFYDKLMTLRDAFDFDLVSESMIKDGALQRYKVLVLVESKVLEREDILNIQKWVRSGGVVVTYDFGGFLTVDGDDTLFTQMFSSDGGKKTSVKNIGSGLAVYVDEKWTKESNPVLEMAKAIDSLSIRVKSTLVPDGLIDGVYVSDMDGKYLIYNTTSAAVDRTILVGIGRKRKVTIEPHSILEFDIPFLYKVFR